MADRQQAGPPRGSVFLVRHGEVEWPDRLYLGQLDLPLSEKGIRQAGELGKRLALAGCAFDHVYTSPLTRCVKTAQAILAAMPLAEGAQARETGAGTGSQLLESVKLPANAKARDRRNTSPAVNIQKEPDLLEINLGEWDGRPIAEIKHLFPKEYEERGRSLLTYQTPGGESFAQLRDRALPCFARIAQSARAQGHDVLIVAHAGVNRMILDDCLKRGIAVCFMQGGGSSGQRQAAGMHMSIKDADKRASEREGNRRRACNTAWDASILKQYGGDFMSIAQAYASCYQIKLAHW